jgi:hypothetical protein
MRITIGVGTFTFDGTTTDFQSPLAQVIWKDWLALTQGIDQASLVKLVAQGKENQAALEANAAKLASVVHTGIEANNQT